MFTDIYHLTEEDVKTETKMILNDYIKELNKILTTFIRVKNRRELSHKFSSVEIILLIYQKLSMIR